MVQDPIVQVVPSEALLIDRHLKIDAKGLETKAAVFERCTADFVNGFFEGLEEVTDVHVVDLCAGSGEK